MDFAIPAAIAIAKVLRHLQREIWHQMDGKARREKVNS